MSGQVVIDASLATMWAVPETHSGRALALVERWVEENTRLLSPCLMLAEANNALYKRVLRGEMTLATAQAALQIILRFAVEIREEPGLQDRALALAHELRRPTTYDCQYLALAAHYGCELWTGDERLYNAVRGRFRWVRWVGESAVPA